MADTDIKRHQMRMAQNVANLKSKQAQKEQIHLLCKSLVNSLRWGE